MLFHGSPIELNVGDVLLPGNNIGKTSNGACSRYVYATADFGFCIADVAEWIGDNPLHTLQEFALWDAALWACSGSLDENTPV